MRRILVAALLLIASFGAKSQIIPPSTISAMRAIVNTQFTTQTGFHAITHVIEGNALDTLWGAIGALNAGIPATLDLLAVTALGATTTHPMTVNDGGTYSSFIGGSATGFQFIRNSDNRPMVSMRVLSTTPSLYLWDNAGGSFYSIFQPGTMTAQRILTTPDESGKIVTHLTQYPISVKSGSTSQTNVQTNGVAITDQLGSTAYASLLLNASGFNYGGILYLKDVNSNFTSNLQPNTLTADHSNTLPDEDGNLVTHVTKDTVDVTDGTTHGKLNIDGVYAYNSTRLKASLETHTSAGYLTLYNNTNFSTQLNNTYNTGNRIINYPDESGILATHVTTASILVDDGNGRGLLSNTKVGTQVAGTSTDVAILKNQAGIGKLILKCNSTHTGTITGASAATVDENYFLPDANGVTFAPIFFVGTQGDIDLSAISYNAYILLTVTADRTITMPTVTNSGYIVKLIVRNTSGMFHWKSSDPLIDYDGSPITTLTNGQAYTFQWEQVAAVWNRM